MPTPVLRCVWRLALYGALHAHTHAKKNIQIDDDNKNFSKKNQSRKGETDLRCLFFFFYCVGWGRRVLHKRCASFQRGKVDRKAKMGTRISSLHEKKRGCIGMAVGARQATPSRHLLATTGFCSRLLFWHKRRRWSLGNIFCLFFFDRQKKESPKETHAHTRARLLRPSQKIGGGHSCVSSHGIGSSKGGRMSDRPIRRLRSVCAGGAWPFLRGTDECAALLCGGDGRGPPCFACGP